MATDAEMIRLSDEWAMVVKDDGTLYLTHLDEDENRYHLELGSIVGQFKSVEHLHEGIRMIRSRGTSPFIH